MLIYRIIVLFMLFNFFGFGQKKLPKFAITYGKVDVKTTSGIDYLFVESHLYSAQEITALSKNNDKVYGYISLTEVSKDNTELYNKLLPYLLKDNKVWNSSFINVSKQEAVDILTQEIDEIYKKGVDGILLDNLDNVSKFGEYHSLEPYVVEMIGKLKERHPEKDLIQNSGLEMVRYTAPFISGVLVESIYTNYDFEHKQYKLRAAKDISNREKSFGKVLRNKHLNGFLVEYAQDSAMVAQVKTKCKRLNVPYVIKDIQLNSL